MAHDQMFECEQKKQFMVGENRVWKWVRVSVSSVVGTAYEAVRCLHCHGEVRVHKQKVDHGPQDHVEHRSKQDSEGCKGGMYFKGVERLSTQPVE